MSTIKIAPKLLTSHLLVMVFLDLFIALTSNDGQGQGNKRFLVLLVTYFLSSSGLPSPDHL